MNDDHRRERPGHERSVRPQNRPRNRNAGSGPRKRRPERQAARPARNPAVPSTGGRSRQRRAALPVGVAIALLLVVTAAGALTWVLTRPVSVTIAATPDDAAIALAGVEGGDGVGVLIAEEVRPGAYTAVVTRSGFETRTVEFEAERFRGATLTVTLEPLPQAVRITARPEEATCRLLRDGVELHSGATPLETELPSGPLTIELALAGHNTLTREIFLDSPCDLDLWLDPEGQVVHLLGIVEASGAPKGVAFTPNGSEVWATILDGPPSIEIYDVATLSRTDGIDLGEHGAVEITFSADGSHAYASQMETARVFEIDTATREVVRTFDTGSAWSKVVELSPDGSRAYVANWSGNDVSEIDLASGELARRIPVARTPRGLWATPDGTALYVAGFDRGDLQRVDLASGEVTSLLSTGGAMRHVVGDADRGVAFASDMARDLIYRLDLATGSATEFATTDEKPNTIALSPDGRILFVSCRGANNPVSYYIPGPEWGSILLFDTATGEPLDAIVGGNQCTALDVSDDGRLLVFSDFLDSRLRFYEIPGYETLATGGGGRFGEHRGDLHK